MALLNISLGWLCFLCVKRPHVSFGNTHVSTGRNCASNSLFAHNTRVVYGLLYAFKQSLHVFMVYASGLKSTHPAAMQRL